MELSEERTRGRVARFLAEAVAGPVEITGLRRLGGGAIQHNWGLEVRVRSGPRAGVHHWVLRLSAARAVSESHGREEEFALLRFAHAAGIPVPEPLFLCRDAAVLGRPFLVMAYVEGVSLGQRVVRGPELAPLRPRLAERLAETLARIHALPTGAPELAFLRPPRPSPAAFAIARYRALLDAMEEPFPVLEWGLRWLERRAPAAGGICLCHRDFRTGNYFVDPDPGASDPLRAVTDWEFAGLSAPEEDLGWFCAKPWRFGAGERDAGGLVARESFLGAYERASARTVARAHVRWWEVLGNIRWAIIAIEQGWRHLCGAERSLELLATGQRAAESELEVLALTELL